MNGSRNRLCMKKIFKIDAALYPLGVLTIVTGFAFHVAGHVASHHVWVLWAWVHTLVSLGLVTLMVQHLVTHKAWVRGLADRLLRRKRRVTILLAVLALAVTLSGVVLLAVRGGGTHVGMLHYRLGILFAVLVTGHALKRLPVLRRALAGGRSRGAGKA